MLQQLPETGAAPGRRLGWMVPSVAVHAAIITVVAFAPARGRETLPREPFIETPIYVATPARHTGARHGDAGGATDAQVPRLPTPDMTFTSVPEPSTPTIWSPMGTSVGVDEIATGGAGEALTSGSSAVLGETVIDEPVRVRVESVPRYPAQLRTLGIQGAVEMEFVVDTTGRVDATTIRAISSPDERFTAAVRSSLRDVRFAPGRYHGHAVRTLVRRSFEFRLEGAR